MNVITNIYYDSAVSIDSEKQKELRAAYLKLMLIPFVDDMLKKLSSDVSHEDAKTYWEFWMTIAFKTCTYVRMDKQIPEIHVFKMEEI